MFSRADAAELLHIGIANVDKLVKAGELVPRRIGDRVLFSKAELERFAGVPA